MNKTRIVIADDHEIVRAGVCALIHQHAQYEICGQVSDGRAAVKLAGELHPDILIMDIGMPELNGLDATRHIKRAHPSIEVLILTTNESDELVRSVFRAGAKSYLLKSDSTKHLIPALAALSRHRTYFSSKIAEVVFAGYLQG